MWLMAAAIAAEPLAWLVAGRPASTGKTGVLPGLVAAIIALPVRGPMSASGAFPARNWWTSVSGLTVNGGPLGAPALSRAWTVRIAVSSSTAGTAKVTFPRTSVVRVTGAAGPMNVLPEACQTPISRSPVTVTPVPGTLVPLASWTLTWTRQVLSCCSAALGCCTGTFVHASAVTPVAASTTVLLVSTDSDASS